MAHFAKLDENNLVIDVNVVSNETLNSQPFPDSEPIGIMFLTEWSGGHTNWKQTSYNNNFRKNYASISYTYDAALDAFIPPQPFLSWTLNEQTCQWDPPIQYPDDNKYYQWNEEMQTWDLVNVY
ncbi:MAG: hypothetical protein WCJ62_00035 [Flavobacterium sp.]